LKIDFIKSGYCFKLDEKYLDFRFVAMNVMDAKKSYLERIENEIDEAIDDNMIKLYKLEQIVKEEC